VPSIAQLLTFVGVAVVLVAMPGPSVLFIVGRAFADGRRTAVFGVLGNEIGEFTLAAAVAFGAGAVVERSSAVFSTLKIVGAGYLIFLGVRALRHRVVIEPMERITDPRRHGVRAMWDGVIVGAFNPKAAIFLTALLPQFVTASRGSATPQMLVLGLVWTLTALVTDVAWVYVAGATRAWFARSPRRLAAIGGVGGLSMIGVGVSLAMANRPE
jgi:threonine/homoserine/homoserine lactone efflux protein